MLKPICRITFYQSLSKKEQEDLPVDNTTNGSNFEPIVTQFYSCSSVEINNAWDQITQTAKIIFPRGLLRVGFTTFKFDDYLNDITSPRKTMEVICGKNSTDFLSPLKVSSWLDVNTQGISTFGSMTASILYNPNINNGEQYVIVNDGSYQRRNGLILHGDIVQIQLGYNILDENTGQNFNTISNGNSTVGKGLTSTGGGSTTRQIPNDYVYQQIGDGSGTDYTNVQWQPANRAQLFKGYVSKILINKDGDIEIDCEDMMYLFNRAKFPSNVYSPSGSSNHIQPYDYFNNTTTHGWTVNNMIIDAIQGRSDTSKTSGIQNGQFLPMQVISTPSTSKPSQDGSNPSTVFNSNPSRPSIQVNSNIDALVGKITTINPSVGDLFKVLSDDYNIPVFFIPNTNILVSTPFVYNLSNNIKPTSTDTSIGFTKNTGSVGQEEFTFIMGQWTQSAETLLKSQSQGFLNSSTPNGYYRNKQNIIKSNLEFKRSNDQPVGALVKSVYKIDHTPNPQQGATTKDGRTRKQFVPYNISIGDPGGSQYTFFYLITKSDGSDGNSNDNPGSAPNIFNSDGSINKTNLTTAMSDYGYQQLSHVNYTGFYGSFTTYIYPYVKILDIVNIVDLSFPERSGRYYVKKTIHRGSTSDGYTQEIALDYKLPSKSIN